MQTPPVGVGRQEYRQESIGHFLLAVEFFDKKKFLFVDQIERKKLIDWCYSKLNFHLSHPDNLVCRCKTCQYQRNQRLYYRQAYSADNFGLLKVNNIYIFVFGLNFLNLNQQLPQNFSSDLSPQSSSPFKNLQIFLLSRQG